MNKQDLVRAIQQKLQFDLDTTIQSARTALEEATHEENKPENEYDTRSLEAAYLAGAQAERAAQIEEQIIVYKNLIPKEFKTTDTIDATALVEVEFNKKTSYVFMMSKGGGMILNFEGKAIQIVTPNSPLGEALVGLKVGETASVEVGETTREYRIISVK